MPGELKMNPALFGNLGAGGNEIAAINATREEVTIPKAGHGFISTFTPIRLIG